MSKQDILTELGEQDERLEHLMTHIRKGLNARNPMERWNSHSRTLIIETILPLYRTQRQIIRLMGDLINAE